MADNTNVANNFKGLPVKDLICAPLKAACEAQVDLATAAYDFMTKIGFNDEKCTETKLVKFNLERPVETPEGINNTKLEVQAPFLGLVPVPSLLIEDVDVSFQMEVTATENNKSATTAEVSTNANFKKWWSPVDVSVQGKVTTSRENTRATNQAAKYQIHVSARQQPPTEGMSRLMDIMASCTAPLSIKSSSTD